MRFHFLHLTSGDRASPRSSLTKWAGRA
jgi:hypothetical protein